LIDTFNIDLAKRYAEANRKGVEQILDWIDELGIACDYEPKDAYTYTIHRARRDEIEAEAFKAEVLARAPLPFETAATLRFPDQAQFNPTQYLMGLGKAFKAAGGRIFENTRVTFCRPTLKESKQPVHRNGLQWMGHQQWHRRRHIDRRPDSRTAQFMGVNL
jgi:glycine/D-amino acid oxidase-like deaminating enzyme